ncbi:hypothetical protein GCM10023211_08760 [Orbus sasakiae]|uniref:Uncharacterized protein n=1 Tax=Orbus sasakiae TaxID=1078475 RepID=A0ABP9N4L2_9GAMM
MSNAPISLQANHHKYQHLSQLRIDFHWAKLAHSDAIELLMTRLLKREYIQGYSWVLNHSQNNASYISALFYLEKYQYDALIVMAAEAYWENYTSGEGTIEEMDVTDNVITELDMALARSKEMKGQHSCYFHCA